MRWSGILFDFDGVIADTEPIHWRCWADVLKPYGFELDWPTYVRHCRGVAPAGMHEALAGLTRMAHKIPDLEQQYTVSKERSFARMASNPPVYPETAALLQSLPEYKIGLVTSASRSIVEPVLEAAGILRVFQALVFGGDVARHKPAPDAYLLAGRRLGANRIVVFEDTDAGIESANAAGFDAVRVTDCRTLAALVRGTLRPRELGAGEK